MLGLVVIERARKRQALRITNLKVGDTNTKFFHLKVNGRRRKNFIQRLKEGQTWKMKHEEKDVIITTHFQSIMTQPPQHSLDFTWEGFEANEVDLTSIREAITEEEVKRALCQLPANKAPRVQDQIVSWEPSIRPSGM